MQHENLPTMKQPTPLWQVISICITVLIASFTGILTQSNKIAELSRDVENMKLEQYNMQLSSDKKFDRIDAKIDLIQSDTRLILINLEKKADRK
jgi:hypothetical protein